MIEHSFQENLSVNLGVKMKKLNSKGYKISSCDKKALEHYLLISPSEWAKNALAGMTNKAIKTILNDYYEIYKEKQVDSVLADYAVIIPGIIAMEEFNAYNCKTPDTFDGKNPPKEKKINRKEAVSEEIWANGFDIEDHEELALQAFYEDPEAMLDWFMTNKIYQRRKAFVKEKEAEMLKDPEVTEIPAHQDDLINCVCAKPGYKNRCESEAEAIL